RDATCRAHVTQQAAARYAPDQRACDPSQSAQRHSPYSISSTEEYIGFSNHECLWISRNRSRSAVPHRTLQMAEIHRALQRTSLDIPVTFGRQEVYSIQKQDGPRSDRSGMDNRK
ncbi:hypothetical protein PFISCL1PPCAC_25615, partial [Pristionchus fissidentatus]